MLSRRARTAHLGIAVGQGVVVAGHLRHPREGSMNDGTRREPHGIRVSIDWVRCTGLGLCIAVAPEAFVFDRDDEVATVRDAEAVDRPTLLAAARACPRDAIYLDEGDGRPLYP
ncbi:MAG: hypothetical protein NVSMB65_08250 [Chloroflexota bacterium]